MNKSLVVIFALLFVTAQVNAELKFVLELYRHGARGPLGSWYDASQQLDVQGELTATGQRQHYNLGQKLRQEYKGFIPEHYNHSQIYVRSSDVNRTLMSAASQLQGMFPQSTGQILPANLSEQYTLPYFEGAQNYLNGTKVALPNNIQVVPIHTQPSVGDLVLQPDNNCKNYQKIKSAFYAEKKDTINFINQQFNNTYQQYSQAINQTVKNFDDMHSLESTFECDRFNGRYVPDFSLALRENATWLTTLSWNFMYDQPELLRAMNTPFLNQLLSYANPVIQNKNTQGLKWVMFSAHDTNVHLVSAALNLTSIDCLLQSRFPQQFQSNKTFYNCESYPRFTSSLLFELHQANSSIVENGVQINSGQFYFRIRRDGKFMNLCEKNSTICSVEEFTQRVNWYVNDFDAVCNGVISQQKLSASETLISPFAEKPEGSSESSYYILALIIQQLVIVIGGYMFYKSKLNKNSMFQQFNDIEIGSTTQ